MTATENMLDAAKALAPIFDNDSPLFKVYAVEIAAFQQALESSPAVAVDSPRLLALVQRAINAWPQFDGDDDVNGAELVDWFDLWRKDAKVAVANSATEATADATTVNARLLAALNAVGARINGEWDHPALVAYGPLSNTNEDILAIVRGAIEG